jgi:type II secretory pathway component PulF
VPLFRYEALDRTGNKVVGAMQVDNEQALNARLTAMGYQPVLVESAARRALTPAPHTPAPSAYSGSVSGLKARESDVARMLHQLFLGFKTGLGTHQCLTTVASQVSSPALRQALTETAQGIQAGSTFSQQLARYPRIFSPGDVGMIGAGELGGFLPEALEAVSQRREEDEHARNRMKVWIWFLHTNMVSLFFFIPVGWFVKDVFPSLNVAVGLAAAWRSLLTISLPLTALYIGFVVWLNGARESPSFRLSWHRMLLRLPILGKLNHVRANAVFTRTLAWLFHAGVLAPTAWEAAAGAVPNLALSQRFMQAKPVLESTGKPSAALQVVGMMDASDVGLVATGETTGELPQALGYLANRYDEQAKIALQESVSRAAGMFRFWAFILGALGFALVIWAYGQGASKLIDFE